MASDPIHPRRRFRISAPLLMPLSILACIIAALIGLWVFTAVLNSKNEIFLPPPGYVAPESLPRRPYDPFAHERFMRDVLPPDRFKGKPPLPPEPTSDHEDIGGTTVK